MRWNPHYHCLVLEGGIDETGFIHHIPIKDTASFTEVFRRRVIKLFIDRGLLDRRFALKILSWKHSGFSVDASVSIPASSKKDRVNLSRYIIRRPVSLQKILYARRKSPRDAFCVKPGELPVKAINVGKTRYGAAVQYHELIEIFLVPRNAFKCICLHGR